MTEQRKPDPDWTPLVRAVEEAAQTIRRGLARFAEALASMDVGADRLPHDPTPDLCWRCDASPACDDVGLCGACREELR